MGVLGAVSSTSPGMQNFGATMAIVSVTPPENSMYKKKSTLALAGFIGLALSGVSHAADSHTKVIAATCLSCHGPNGNSIGAIPGLNGLSKDYIVKAMQNYKSGKRIGTIMKKHAVGYTDAEFEAMGAYFASLK